jgi:TolB protein
VTNREGNYDLWLMGADGADPRPLTTHPERDDFPAWHPTDNRLACIAIREGRHDIWLLELD